MASSVQEAAVTGSRRAKGPWLAVPGPLGDSLIFQVARDTVVIVSGHKVCIGSPSLEPGREEESIMLEENARTVRKLHAFLPKPSPALHKGPAEIR